MEVHAHSHTALDPDSHRGLRKKWTHYFWEFLMLFLAVFCGFLAEYQLEHKIEKDREKQYIESLADDIKADTVILHTLISARTSRDLSLDTLSRLLNTPTPVTYSRDIYFHAITASRTLSIRFVPNDGTLQQLKNSGAFRLIRSREVADSIAKYDVHERNFIRQQEVEEGVISDYRQASAKIFNALYFEPLMDANLNPVRLPDVNPTLLSFEKTDLETWNYKLYAMKTINKANRRNAAFLLVRARNLLNTLNRNYK